MNFEQLIASIESSSQPLAFAKSVFESYCVKKTLRLKRPIEERTIGNYLELFVRELPQDEKMLFSEFVFNWRELMGAVADFSQPVKLENKILTIEVSNSMFAHTLRSSKDEILHKFQEFIGESNLIDLSINSSSPF